MMYVMVFCLGYLACALVVMARVNKLKMQLRKVERTSGDPMYTAGVAYSITQIERWLGL